MTDPVNSAALIVIGCAVVCAVGEAVWRLHILPWLEERRARRDERRCRAEFPGWFE